MKKKLWFSVWFSHTGKKSRKIYFSDILPARCLLFIINVVQKLSSKKISSLEIFYDRSSQTVQSFGKWSVKVFIFSGNLCNWTMQKMQKIIIQINPIPLAEFLHGLHDQLLEGQIFYCIFTWLTRSVTWGPDLLVHF